MSAMKNLLDYLPPEHQQRILMLVQRLQQETDSKEHYMRLYEETKGQLGELQLKYNQVKDQNLLLKQQIHNSFSSIVASVRKNMKNKKEVSRKKSEEDEDEEEMSSHSDEAEQLEVTASVNKTLSAEKPPRPHHNQTTPILHLTQKKARVDSQEVNRSQLTSNRSQQLQNLRKEVRQMQESKKVKEEKERSVKEKHRLVDEIKNRYKKPGSERGDHSVTLQVEDYSLIEARRQDSQKGTSKKPVAQVAKQNRRVENTEQANQRKPQATAVPKGPTVTEADYSEVLDMINYYNL